MNIDARPRWPYLFGAVLIIGFVLFLIDFPNHLVQESPGTIQTQYPGEKIKSRICRIVGVKLETGAFVIAQIAPGQPAKDCMAGDKVVVREYKTLILGGHSYEYVYHLSQRP